MRWSLILSAFITLLSLLSLLSFALVTTQISEILEKRARGNSDNPKSSTYRRNSMMHPYGYTLQPSGTVTRHKIPVADRVAYNQAKLSQKGRTDADHLYEMQMYHHHVEKVLGTKHRSLPQALKDTVKKILNGKNNVAPVDKEWNRSKGQLVKEGLKGKPLRTVKPVTRHYSMAVYEPATQTAQSLQHAFSQHGYGTGQPTFHDTLDSTYRHARVLQPSPGSSYQQVGPNHYRYTPSSSTSHAYIVHRRDI